MEVGFPGDNVVHAVSRSNKELIDAIKEASYKRVTENIVSERAFEDFIAVYGGNIGNLNAFCQRVENIFNVYWKCIGEASLYTVEAYKSYCGNIYHLKDYTAERNEGFVSINGLVGHGYIFRVIAESRDGKILARATVR